VNPDVSAAPEIAQLMEPPRTEPTHTTYTVGALARELRNITGAPERWWRLVRFDAEHPVHVDIGTDGPHRAWLTIVPPGADDQEECSCDVVTVVAGELTETATSTAPLVPGKIRVHGGEHPHRAANRSDGYTVSVHISGRGD
jgi:hypothetical protein